jgi:Domain of unknown function (DUF4439)
VTTSAAVDGLQRTLAAEHAAVFVLAALGGRASSLTDAPLRAALTAAYDVHLQRRDELRQMIGRAGSDPVAAEPAYRLPTPLRTAPAIAAEALRVQRVCVTTYAALVAVTADADRRWAVDALVSTAVTEAAFGGGPQPLPGLAT